MTERPRDIVTCPQVHNFPPTPVDADRSPCVKQRVRKGAVNRRAMAMNPPISCKSLKFSVNTCRESNHSADMCFRCSWRHNETTFTFFTSSHPSSAWPQISTDIGRTLHCATITACLWKQCMIPTRTSCKGKNGGQWGVVSCDGHRPGPYPVQPRCSTRSFDKRVQRSTQPANSCLSLTQHKATVLCTLVLLQVFGGRANSIMASQTCC